MTLTVHRDLDEVRSGLEKFLGRTIRTITRPTRGWSCETIVVDEELVVRLPPAGEGIFPTYDLAQQAAVQQAVSTVGVPVPAPATYEADPSVLGSPFITMPFVKGVIVNEYTPADPWLRSLEDDQARYVVWHSFVETIAAIHRVDSDGLALRGGVDSELDYWTEYLDWSSDGAPPGQLSEALAWCRESRPVETADRGVLWGDVRLGNVVFDPERARPRAVLDWDMVSAGPVEMDLSWFLALEQVPIDLTGRRVPGFSSHEATVAQMEKLIGRALVDLDWYEIFALVRATAVSTRIAILFERSGESTMFKPGEGPTLDAALARIAARGQ